jgi:uncharacterized protein (TIGR02217 family)
MAREGFHDVLFPLPLLKGARGGPTRRTQVTKLASGSEIRRSRWSQSLRRWSLTGAPMGLAEAQAVLAFFEAREGRRFAFAFHDPLDGSSAAAGDEPTAFDQHLGAGDGGQTVYGFRKAYGVAHRRIDLVRPGTLTVGIDGAEVPASAYTLSGDRDRLTFAAPPPAGASVTAGFLFDVPVRFETDELDFEYGVDGASIPGLSLVEVRLP